MKLKTTAFRNKMRLNYRDYCGDGGDFKHGRSSQIADESGKIEIAVSK